MRQAGQHALNDHLGKLLLQRGGERDHVLDACSTAGLSGPGCGGDLFSLADGSAGFRAAPSSTGRLTVSASSSPRTPSDRQSKPGGVQVGFQQRPSGENQVDASTGISQRPDPRNSQIYAVHELAPGSPTSSIMPGARANSSNRSRLRTLQNRLNLKNSVTHPSSDRKSQTSGLEPQIGHERTVHGCLVSQSDSKGRGSPASWHSAFESRTLLGFLLVAAPGRGKAPRRRSVRKSGSTWNDQGPSRPAGNRSGVSPYSRWATC